MRTPKLLSSDKCELKLSYVEGVTFTELLEQQERAGSPDFEPWEKLVNWLCCFYESTGLVMEDCNLRNFILDAQGRVCGIDFEQCREGSLVSMAGAVCAFVELYDPQETPLKMSVSHFLQESFSENAGISAQKLAEETERRRRMIAERREHKKLDAAFSAVILAGGKSSRMGSCKAELPWAGKTLLEHQVDKICSLGIRDIIVSGYSKPVPGTRYIPDIYPKKGPLGGIHAGLNAAQRGTVFVISVDAPLFSTGDIKTLLTAHLAGSSPITVVEHSGIIEPLIGVYSRSLSGAAESVLQSENTSVKRLFDKVGFAACEFTDENSVRNCNTIEEYEKLRLAAEI